MGIDLKLGRFCDECGRLIAKAHRIHRDKDYCSSCYPRVFIPASCSQCGAGVRVHKRSDETPICRACIASTRHCARCGKPAPKVGKIVNGQAICPSCAPYYNEKQLCSCCGKLSFRVTRMPKLGINDPICDSCRNKVTHCTCSVCGKYRPRVGELDNGLPYCKSCKPGSEIHHDCPSCGSSVAGEGLSKCRSCNNLQRIRQETSLYAASLNEVWTKSLLLDFGVWLHEKQGGSPNCLKVLIGNEPFFERLDKEFQALSDIGEKNLLDGLGPAFIRKHLLAAEFLQQVLQVTISADSKAAKGECNTIAAKLDKNSKMPYGLLLKNYAQYLKEEALSERTARLYLRAAEKFCAYVGLQPDQPWKEHEIEMFLIQHSGSRASLFRFITYCKAKLGWFVSMPSKAAALKVTASKEEIVLFKALMKQIKDKDLEVVATDTLEKAIALGFGYSLHEFRTKSLKLKSEEIGISFWVNSTQLKVPTGMVDLVREFARRINTPCSSF